MDTQIDVGLDSLGTGVEKILGYMAANKRSDMFAETMGEVTGKVTGSDEIVQSYLAAANKFAKRDPKVAQDMLNKALERADKMATTNAEFYNKDPEQFVTFHNSDGTMNLDAAIKARNKTEAGKKRMVEFLLNADTNKDQLDPDKALLDVTREQSMVSEDAKTYIDATKHLSLQKASTGRARLNVFARQATSSNDPITTRLKSIDADNRVQQGAVNNANVEISKYNKQMSDLQGKLVPGNSPAVVAMNSPILQQIDDLKIAIDGQKARITEANDGLWRNLDDQLYLYQQKGVTTPADQDRKTILEALQAIAEAKGDRNEALRIIIRQIKDPKSPLKKKLKLKGTNLNYYNLPVNVEENP